MPNQHQQPNQNNALVLCVLKCSSLHGLCHIWRITIAVHLSLVFHDSTCSPMVIHSLDHIFQPSEPQPEEKVAEDDKIDRVSFIFLQSCHPCAILFVQNWILKWHSCHCLHVGKCLQYLFFVLQISL